MEFGPMGRLDFSDVTLQNMADFMTAEMCCLGAQRRPLMTKDPFLGPKGGAMAALPLDPPLRQDGKLTM